MMPPRFPLRGLYLPVRHLTTANHPPPPIKSLFSNASSPSPPSSSSTSVPPTHHLITLTRSPLSLPSYSSRTLEALGLRKRYQSVLHPFSPSVAGQILRVKEIVTVKNVSEEEGMRWMGMRKSQGSGVVVTGRVFGGGKRDTTRTEVQI